MPWRQGHDAAHRIHDSLDVRQFDVDLPVGHLAALFAWNYARMPVRLQSLGAWTCVVSLAAVLLMAVTTTALQRRVVTRWSTAGTRTARLIRLTLA